MWEAIVVPTVFIVVAIGVLLVMEDKFNVK